MLYVSLLAARSVVDKVTPLVWSSDPLLVPYSTKYLSGVYARYETTHCNVTESNVMLIAVTSIGLLGSAGPGYRNKSKLN